ncbi:hypothetical protein BCR42DRAFT_438560 [Absidia repens]|uniref:Uncharacterized protein n=1 Tax=Absidia repens TaxID=90262 RepID=A0A1X2IFF1_9FUNG|nr:hypothetical protein BCR42DRAFT_438560 [Absidia repens]
MSVVHAQSPNSEATGNLRIIAIVCPIRNNKCSYYFEMVQNTDAIDNYHIKLADCNSAQGYGYTFTKTPDYTSSYVQSPCSGMSVDTIHKYSKFSRHPSFIEDSIVAWSSWIGG